MACVRGLIFFVAVLCSFCVPSFARAAYSSEAEAYQACYAKWQQGVSANGGSAGDSNCIVSVEPSVANGLVGYYSIIGHCCNAGNAFEWILPHACEAGTDAPPWSSENGIIPDSDGAGCCTNNTVEAQVSYGSKVYWEGDAKRTGDYCTVGYSASSPPGPRQSDNPICEDTAMSCYNPKTGDACYTTEYGERICAHVGGSPAGGCAVGATGAVCIGAPSSASPPPTPPAPPDPPVSSGQPPDNSVSASQTSGGTTNNYTQNNYSGTSPGSGGSSTSGSGDSTGSGSNANGAGNSGAKGTGSDGKCADGTVPTASGCSGTYTDSGCDTPPACFGDAVMCGNNRELHNLRCNLKKAYTPPSDSDLRQIYANAGIPYDGGVSGDPSASGLVDVEDIGAAGFDASGLGLPRACPANPTFSVFGHSYSLDLGPLCNFGSVLGLFVLLCSYLVGLRIVATGKS